MSSKGKKCPREEGSGVEVKVGEHKRASNLFVTVSRVSEGFSLNRLTFSSVELLTAGLNLWPGSSTALQHFLLPAFQNTPCFPALPGARPPSLLCVFLFLCPGGWRR